MKTNRPVDSLARDHDEEAIEILREIMIDPFSEAKDRIRAAESLLDRGHGKAAQAIIAVPATKKMMQQAAALEDSDLVAIIRAEPLPRLSAPAPEPVIEADFEPVVDDIDPLLL